MERPVRAAAVVVPAENPEQRPVSMNGVHDQLHGFTGMAFRNGHGLLKHQIRNADMRGFKYPTAGPDRHFHKCRPRQDHFPEHPVVLCHFKGAEAKIRLKNREGGRQSAAGQGIFHRLAAGKCRRHVRTDGSPGSGDNNMFVKLG